VSNEILSVGILGTGSCLPEKIITNQDLEKMVDTSDEWITQRTGISERRILEKDTPVYKIGAEAARRALADSGIAAEDLDLIITATVSPDYMYPQAACLIQGSIGASKAAAFDLNAACSGFVYALTVAKQFIATGIYKHILVVGCEGLSKSVDWEDRNTCILFGDAAGAVVLGPVEKETGILSTVLGADGSGGDVVTLPLFHFTKEDLDVRIHNNKHVVWMDGGKVLKFAVKIMAQATEEALEAAKLSVDDLSMIFPHQANTRIIDGAIKRLGIPDEKLYPIIHKYGNISSASIPVALDEAVKAGRIKKGDNLVFVGFGGGLTWASAVVKWSK
jgi:3-oxoacyl-[acyl-carrier-protein] synthase III